MTATQGLVAMSCDSSLGDIPAWKRDLILRKRANTRIHSGLNFANLGSGCTAASHPTLLRSMSGSAVTQPNVRLFQGAAEFKRSVSGPIQPQSSVRNSVSSNSLGVEGGWSDIENKNCDAISENELKNGEMLNKGPRKSGPDEEDLHYGPGIVSKLKNRYMSLAMRENKSRPSLRRFSSLEDLLDGESQESHERGRSTVRDSSDTRKEAMKRARSMDSVAHQRLQRPQRRGPHVTSPPPREVVIIEKQKYVITTPKDPVKRGIVKEDIEYPTPDLVKHVKQIFEAPSRPKPAIKAKPVGLHLKKLPVGKSLVEAKSYLRQVPQPLRTQGPRSTLPLKPMVLSPTDGALPSVTSPVGLTPITSSVTAPLVNGHVKAPRASSPVPPDLPPSPILSHRAPKGEALRVEQENLKNTKKSLDADKPLIALREPNKVLKPEPSWVITLEKPQENLSSLPSKDHFQEKEGPIAVFKDLRGLKQDSQKPESAKKGDSVVDASSKSVTVQQWAPPGAGGGSFVRFDFTKSRNATPDYIENDLSDFSDRKPKIDSGYVIMTGYDGSSSTDGDDLDDEDDPSGCSLKPEADQLAGIMFEGEAVIINGRSNLQRQPKSKKMNISFNDSATTTYEYPSETSFAEDISEIGLSSLGKEEDHRTPAKHGCGLATYTPSKNQLVSTFELGVSKTSPSLVSSKSMFSEKELESLTDFLLPADENETITWSAGKSTDMLF